MLKDVCEAVVNTGKVLNEIRGKVRGCDADLIIDRILTSRLIKILPIPVVSEEGWKPERRPQTYWLIDPIDGTASYDDGYSGFVTQAALMDSGVPVLGVVYAPVTGELFYCRKGEGAYKWDVPIKVNTGKQRILIDNYPEPRGAAKDIYQKLGLEGYIESGSISLKMCRVAEGSADVFYKDVTVRLWDLAAPQVIVEGAGGSVTDCHGGKIDYCGNYELQGVYVDSGGRNIEEG